MARVSASASGVNPDLTRVLFVNAGILGMQSFSKYIREAMALDPEIEARHINLSEDLSLGERIIRRALCVRWWRDGDLGLRNLDYARFRHEYHAGLQARRRIRTVMAEGGIDVLHFHRQATAYASLGWLRRIPGIVSIDTTQDILLDNPKPPALERLTYQPNVAMDGRIFHAAAAIVSTSQWAANHLRRRYPDCRTPVHVMPAPVRLQFFEERWIDERFASATTDYRPRVLFVGGDFTRKGGRQLLEAWRQAELYRVARLDLVTDWPLGPIDMPDVRMVRGVASYSADWSELWQLADIFVMPTLNEAFGTVFQEAGAAGLPRIGTNINAIPEMIVDGESGLLVPPGDPAALARALRRLIESPGLRRDLGRAARARVVRQSSPEEYRANLGDIIFSVARRQGSTVVRKHA
jgi:glycosyltransferase involved in cell wall biosynthesis